MPNTTRQAEQQVEQINQILSCAFITAMGSANLALEEIEELENTRPYIIQLLEARQAVEHYESTRDLDGAINLLPAGHSGNTSPADDASMSFTGGVPPFLSDLKSRRDAADNSDDIVALEEAVAANITDTYLQKIAVHICTKVARADGEFAESELTSVYYMCKKWNTTYYEASGWFQIAVRPVLTGLAPGRRV